MKVNFNITLRVRKAVQNEPATIALRVSANNKRKIISLGIKATPKDWNAVKSVVKSSDSKYIFKNELIASKLNAAMQIYLAFAKDNKAFNFNSFETEFKRTSSNASFYTTIALEIKKRSLKDGTKRDYNSQLTKLEKFSKKLSYQDIDFEFVHSYKTYMIDVLGNKLSTCYKSLSTIKTFIKWAIAKKLMQENPFDQIPIRKFSGTRHYLTVSELEIIENLYEAQSLKPELQDVLKYFLFACYTGLRFTDLKKLRKADFKKELISGTQYDVIRINMHKTGEPVTIPIIPKAKKLYDLTGKIEMERALSVHSNQYTNRSLKQIMSIADIEKPISFHCARHTFATVGLEKGIPIETISNVLGHTAIRITQIYAKVTQTNKLKYLLRL